MSNLKDRILGAVALGDLVGERVALTGGGGRQRGLCPFHQEKTPSFYVFADHYHCFGCGAHGDAIGFVRETMGVGFLDALRWLGERSGVDTSELDSQRAEFQHYLRRGLHTRVLAQARELFSEQLWGPAGESARAYLSTRGVSEATARTFELGWAPDDPHFVGRGMLGRDTPRQALLEASLVSLREDGRCVDFFRNRLVIPVRDAVGRLVGFGGRNLGPHGAKYKNSRFEKSEILFALSLSRDSIRRQGQAFVVEGYFDVISLWQAGLCHVVAAQGTALSTAHLRALAALCREVTVFFDGDAAGAQAALKVAAHALEIPGLRVRVAVPPDGEDPDSLARGEGGRQAVEHVARGASDVLDFAISRTLRLTEGSDLLGQVELRLVPWLASLDDELRRHYLTLQVAERTGLELAVLRRRVQDARRPGARAPQPPRALPPPPPAPLTALPPSLREWLGYLICTDCDPGAVEQAEGFYHQVLAARLSDTWRRTIADTLAACRHAPGARAVHHARETLSTSEVPEVSQFLDWLERHRSAFSTTPPSVALARLEKAFRNQQRLEHQASLKALLLQPDLDPELRLQLQAAYLKTCQPPVASP